MTTATLPGGAHFDGAATAGLERHDTVGRLLAMVPHDASVAATNGLVAHLANRPAVHEFPEGQPAEYVVIDSRTQPSRYAVSLGYWPAVTRLPAQGYRIVASADGVAVWHR